MSRILCLVLNPAIDISCAADRVQPTLKTRTHDQLSYPGGGGTNVARVIAELGARPELAFLSGGATGGVFQALLSDYWIDQHAFEIADSNRIAYNVFEKSTGFEYRFVPEGPKVEASELAGLLAFSARFNGDYLVASGSLPAGVPADTYAQLAKLAGASGARFVLDTSGAALAAAIETGGIFLLKPSMGELEAFAGRRLDEREAGAVALDLVKRGSADNVAVSFGRQGALLANANGVLHAPSVHVRTVSATGAGDSFVGAMVWALSQGRSEDEAFRLGLAAGAAAAMTPGTELCRRDDVFTLYEQASALSQLTSIEARPQ